MFAFGAPLEFHTPAATSTVHDELNERATT
jgi:hypothetical protein